MKNKRRRFLKKIKNWIIYLIVKSGIKFIRSIQRNTAIKFLQSLSLLGFYLVRSERRKTIRHLTIVYGSELSQRQIARMAKAVFFNLGRNMADAFRLSVYNAQTIDRFVKVKGLEVLDRALKKGKGILALTGHIGNWELMGSFLALKGYPINVVGAPVYDPRLDDLVVENRMKSGMKYIARGSATREIIRAIRRNEIVGLLIDQDTRHVDGVFIDFMGKNAYTPVGPVILAMKTGAAVIPMAIHIQQDNTHLIEIEPDIPLQFSNKDEINRLKNTEICSKAIEKFIRKYPTQWVWMHNRWKTKPD